ncbi:helix-turn-helix transcriptional regulator [Halorussus caseinilyticus]|uniref:Helix-turn-helix transcriptional regulator n=1 Tax=Halorussus caseinilyticus TaxID=3034025 RepID=A0ABD5WLY8_9EURY
MARELEESRSTIDRALRELERVGFVARDDSGYRTTLAGELALEEYDRHTDRVHGLAELQDALTAMPTDAPLDAALFEDADVSLPTQHSPHRPVEALEPVLADADHVRAFGTTVIPAYVDMYYEQIVDEEMTAEVIFSTDVLEWLLSRHEEVVKTIAETEGVVLSETDDDYSFNLLVAEHGPEYGGACHERPDCSVGVMLYDEGTILGFVHNDTCQAVAWGETLFDRLADGADRLGTAFET